MADTRKLVDLNFDPSLKEFKNCTAASGSSVVTYYRIGVDKSVQVDGTLVETGDCPDDTYWFSTKDGQFTVTATPEGTYDFGRETIETSDSEYVQTNSGKTTATKSYTIVGSYGSEFIQLLQQIQANDSLYGLDTKLMKAYSNGGFHLQTVIEYKDLGVTVTRTSLNVKLGAWQDLLLGFDEETEVAFEWLIEYSELVTWDGDTEGAFGVPVGSLTLTSDIGLTDDMSSLTYDFPEITGDILDKLYGTSPQEVLISVFNGSKSAKEIASTVVEIGDTGELPLPTTGDMAVEEGDIIITKIFLKPSKNMLLYSTSIETVATLVTPPPAPAAKMVKTVKEDVAKKPETINDKK